MNHLTIDVSKTPRSKRKELVDELIRYYPDVTTYIDYIAEMTGTVQILLTDVDGTITNTPGGEPGSAFMLACGGNPFNYEKQVDINDLFPLFEDKLDELKYFYKNLCRNGIVVIPVTQNFKAVTLQIMKEITGAYHPGWYGSSRSSQQLYEKKAFIQAVVYYIEGLLQHPDAKIMFIDDSKIEIADVTNDTDLKNKVTVLKVSPWLGDNRELQTSINQFFEI